MSGEMPLVAVPNFSEGRNTRVIGALEATLGSHARVLNRHYDAQHNRSVFTMAAPPEKLVEALVAGAAHALDLIDLRSHQGLHPHVGALDVSPVVWQIDERHDAAVEGATAVAEGIAALGIPVFFYGELATAPERRERAYFRQGGPTELARRMGSGELRPDLGPDEPHPSAGATLVTAREPLVAFNVELDTSDTEIAREIAAELREAGRRVARRTRPRAAARGRADPGLDEHPRSRGGPARQGRRGDLAARRAARREADRGGAGRARPRGRRRGVSGRAADPGLRPDA